MTKNILLFLIGAVLFLSSCKTTSQLTDTSYNEDEYIDDTNEDVYSGDTTAVIEETAPIAAETTVYTGDENAAAATEPEWEEAPTEPEPIAETPVEEPAEDIRAHEENVSMVQGMVEQKPFCIILGSFAKQNNAINFRNRLMSEGYSECTIYRNEAGLYRVSAAGFDSQRQACRELAKIKTEYPEFSDGWLLRKK